MLPFWAVAMICDYFYPIQQQVAESKIAVQKYFDGDKDPMNHGWLLKLAARDLLNCIACGVFWTWFVNQKDMRLLKFNKDLTHAKHLAREVTYSISTILMGTIIEAMCMVAYATGYCNTYFLNYSDNKLAYWSLIILMPLYRDGHFYWVHRAMHPWNTKYIPDVGQWLYNVAHSLHH